MPAAGCRDRSRVGERRKVTRVLRQGQQVEQLRRRVRHERLAQNADLADDLRRHVEHRLLPRGIGLGQRPRRLAREIAVGFGDDREDRIQRLVDLLRLHRFARERDHAVGLSQDRLVAVAERARLRHDATELLADHRQRALRQVAEVVGEIGIDARDDRFVVVVAVLAERHLAQEEVAHLVDAVLIRKVERIDDVADRLRHLLAAVEQEAVRINPLRQRNAG